MFSLKTRIVDTLEPDPDGHECDSISGFVDVMFGDHRLDLYYHENPLRNDEIGMEAVEWWIELFLMCADLISTTKYIAFVEPDTQYNWIEFELSGEIINVHLSENRCGQTHKTHLYEKSMEIEFVRNATIQINYVTFVKEVVRATKFFLTEIEAINHSVLKTNMIYKMIKRVNRIMENLIIIKNSSS